MIYLDDTIAAIATGTGAGGIGIIRISGPDAWGIGNRLFHTTGDSIRREVDHPRSSPFRRMLFGILQDPESGETIDKVLTTFMAGPHTYTGEDTVEINSHGGRVLLTRVLELVLTFGARMAEPGEFTRRAFLNGRMDLTQAEAVADLINARSDLARRRAVGMLQGSLGEIVSDCRDILVALRTRISAGIDFPDDVGEMVDPIADANQLRERVIERLLPIVHRYRHTRILTEGLRVAIVGRPNVGKSSLLNALLQRDRALVTDTPGTTRDTIEEAVDVGGIPVVFIDTAGLRASTDPVEQLGIERAWNAMDQAQLVLFVIDAAEGVCPGDRPFFERIDSDKTILVVNKIDIASGRLTELPSWPAVSISAKTRAGIATLESAIREKALNDELDDGELTCTPNFRQMSAIDAAISSVQSAIQGLFEDAPEMIVDIDLSKALSSLNAVMGNATDFDVLDEVFSRFCIGK